MIPAMINTATAPKTVLLANPKRLYMGPAAAAPTAKPICPYAMVMLISEPRRSPLTSAVNSAEKGLRRAATSTMRTK